MRVTRARSRLAVLGSRPWLFAPWGARRHGIVTAAVLLSIGVLCAVVASAPAYVSTVGTAALVRGDRASCPDVVSPYVAVRTPIARPVDDSALSNTLLIQGGRARFQALDAAVRAAGGRLPGVATAPIVTLVSDGVQVGATMEAARDDAQSAVLVARPDALKHVRVLRSHGIDGAYLPDTLARSLRLDVGGVLPMYLEGKTIRLPIAGVYADLTQSPLRVATLPAFWCQLNQLPPNLFSSSLYAEGSPPVVLVSAGQFAVADQALQFREDAAFWDFPLRRTGLTLGGADRVVAGAGRPGEIRFAGSLPTLVGQAHAIRASVSAAIRPIVVAAAAVALLLVGGAGLFWSQRRARDVRLLTSRGVGPAMVGVKAVLENLAGAVAGGVIGLAVAELAVRRLGPSSLIEPDAGHLAYGLAAAAAAAGLVVVGIFAAARARGLGSGAAATRRSLTLARAIPWEIPFAVAAVVALRTAPSAGAGEQDTAGLVRPGALLVVAPIVLLLAVVVLVARLGVVALRAAHRRTSASGRSWVPNLGWLVARRLAGTATVAAALVIATALPVGLLVYSAAVNKSSQTTIAAKVSLFVGSNTRVSGEFPDVLPPGLPGHTTEVFRANDDQAGVDVLGIDPSSWGSVASWNPAYAGSSLSTLMSRLARPAPAGTVPVVLVGSARGLPATGQLPGVSGGPRLDPVGTASYAPGMRGGAQGNGIVLAPADVVRQLFPGADREIWSTSPAPVLVSALTRLGIPPSIVVDGTGVVDASSLLPVTWTFDYVTGLGVLIALIAVSGLALRLELQQRSRAVSDAFARRMGLGGGASLTGLGLELAIPCLFGFVLGVLVSLAGGHQAVEHLDFDPGLSPSPLWTPPLTTVATAAVASVVVLLVATVLTVLRSRRSNVAELLRG